MDEDDRESPCGALSDSCGLPGLHLSTLGDSEDEGLNQETVIDEEPTFSPYLEWLEELEKQDDGDGDLAVAADKGKKPSYSETSRRIKLGQNLDQLDHFHRQKEHDVLKARENLNLCRQNIESLMAQRDNAEKEIDQQKAADNSVAVFRLRAKHRQLCQQLQVEEDLEGHIITELKQQELELNKVEVEIGRFSSLRQELEEEGQAFQVLKAQKAATRLQQERKASKRLQLRMQHLKDNQTSMAENKESEDQKKLEQSQANRKVAVRYLKETMKRMQQQEAEKEQQTRELLEKRMQAIKSLKSNIEATQESLRVRQSRVNANAQKTKQQQSEMRQSLQAQGINSTKHMYQQKQLERLKQQQAEFEEKQKSNRVAIVAKILQEEQLLKTRKSQQVLLPKPPVTDKFLSLERAREKLWHSLNPSPPSFTEERIIQYREFSDISATSSTSFDIEDLEEATLQEVDHQSFPDSLAEPEFSGLWEQNSKKLLDERNTLNLRGINQEEPAVQSGKIHKSTKKAHGTELAGAPFISKPGVILFKDFEVGKMYKKKIVLTNTSHVTNYCKLLGLSAQLKDFISIKFKPLGSLATGMSCDLQAVFQPMINEDLEGEIQFASAVGPFSVPVRCTTMKCELQVDSQFIDFGSHVVGQTISRTITLTNKGALATLFSLDTSTRLSPETSHVQMPSQISANTCQKTKSQSTNSDYKSSASVNVGDLQPEQETQPLSEELEHQQPVSEASAADPGAITDGCTLINVDAQVDESSSDSNDLTLGNVREGEIGPFQSINLEVFFTPTIPGEARLTFQIKCSNISSKPILIQVRGVAVSIPVWVVQPNIDLKICMFDFVYQDVITMQSRASTALRLTFEVCPEMRKHMEVLPKTGFIQAGSSFKAQLKFSPRHSLSKDAKRFFDSDTGVLEFPMTVHVAGQVQPVHFTVHAVVTSSDMQFDPTDVDFGYCSIYQSVKSTVRLTNLSLLPQDFGFLGVPEFIEVQPNDGFGTLLPKESLEIDLIFSANKAKKYSFQLCCKSGINRDLLLSCRAVGVRPPLKLSHSLIQFGGTAVGDKCTAILHLINQETQCNHFKQAVPPVGKDAMTPRLFSFAPPEGSDISIAPSAGRLLPGERCVVQVMFRPRLLEQEIKEEAMRLLHQACEKEVERNGHTEQETEIEIPLKSSKKKASMNQKDAHLSDDSKTDKLPESPHPDSILPGSEAYEKARASLLYSFSQRYSEYVVPCFISDGDPPENDRQAQPLWSPSNTLYLKLQCLAVQPPLVVLSNNGRSVIDFQQVVVGMKIVRKCTIQNISRESLDLSSSVLNMNGPFSLLNALRCIRPGEKHTLVLSFSPSQDKKYRETLEVCSKKMTLALTLRGEGVMPAVTLSPPGGVLDFGYVLKNESVSQVLKLQNNSVVSVDFKVLLASLCAPTPQDEADRVTLLLGGYIDSKVQTTVGTQNYSGLCVFSVMPIEGSIPPGQSQDITVTFQPDHPSVNYSDRLTVELINKNKVFEVNVKGAVPLHSMYLYGGDILTVPIESLLPSLMTSQAQLTETEAMGKPSIPVLVTLQACYSGGAIRPAVRELHVGCIRSTLAGKKVPCSDTEVQTTKAEGW
ncbi:cilia- and flagella-associated protein 74 isoform X2 [Betta splendens]|uniref:Cilia- and flagella-associated protein 74 isoform X2 n=1 Tax=Betta splendens TaxID=158456 RepID=A0A6P7MV85_BETSP|nr:cilia- and flagella-associated protein 74 isoform X2 [Betta splendens]